MRRSPARATLLALWPALPAVAVVGAGFLFPVLHLCLAGLRGGDSRAAPLLDVVRLAPYRRALVHSLGLSAVVAALSVALSLPAAVFLARGRAAGSSVLRAAFAVPLSLSGVVIGFLAVAMLGHAGALPRLLHAPSLGGMAYGLTGLVVAYLYFEIPRATLTLEAALAALDEGLLAAARSLGARPHQVLVRVLLPLCRPALFSAFGVTFAAALGSFGVALILAARFPLLPVELYRALTGTLDDGLASAMALWLGAVSLLVLALLAGRGRPPGRRRRSRS